MNHDECEYYDCEGSAMKKNDHEYEFIEINKQPFLFHHFVIFNLQPNKHGFI